MHYDLVVIGAGWAGFNAAITAKNLGLRVAIVERSQLGGTCLNRGCIPTKALLQSAKILSLIKKSKNFGITTSESQVDFIQLQARKEKIVQQLRSGLEFSLKGIEIFNAHARILNKDTIDIGGRKINTRFTLIATGSKPVELKTIKFDRKKILSSDDILNLSAAPKSLLVIGGGVIGCEFASLFSVFGSQVTIIEKMPQLLPGEDKEVAGKLQTNFKKKGIKIATNTDATTLDFNNYDLALLSIGRIAQFQDLGLEALDVNLEKGRINTDNYLKTNIPNIYAAGDCTGKILLAHFAAYQGRIAAANIALPQQAKEVSDLNIPNCIFTDPEIASVGLNEENALSSGKDIKTYKFDFLGSGMARILDETDGFIKIICDKKTDEILGASIIGPKATELIGILTVAMQAHLKISQLKEMVLAHPTLSESIRDALKEIRLH